jgi:hypothetical protein
MLILRISRYKDTLARKQLGLPTDLDATSFPASFLDTSADLTLINEDSKFLVENIPDDYAYKNKRYLYGALSQCNGTFPMITY